MLGSTSPRVFISYSHRGNGPEWKSKLLRALHVFESQHLLDIWQDGKIRVSSFWDDDIKKAMSQADIAIVLLTQESLESEYILNVEFPYLRDRQLHDNLTVFPVVCEECDWRSHDWLNATQAPNGSNPLTALPTNSQERIFRQLATDVAEELSNVAMDGVSAETAADTRVYLDKFPLTRGPSLREDRLIGREQEIALLDLAFTQPHTAIVSLVAWGGVGKTVLVQHWLRRLESEQWRGTRQVYAWSFYSQGTTEDRQASEDMFLAHALEWFGVQCEPTLSPWEKGRLLADAVANGRTLLILDGIEPLQYPPGPMGGQLRAPGVQSLIKHLARKAKRSELQGICIVTTREPLTDFADFQRRESDSWGSVLQFDLGNLTNEAGAALLHNSGVKHAGAAEIKSDDKELIAASHEVQGHALTLSLLGRFIARAHSGDILRRDLVNFEQADRMVQGGTTFKMLAAFEKWFTQSGVFGARQLAILNIIGLFDRPAESSWVAELRKPPSIPVVTEPLFLTKDNQEVPLPDEDWNTATAFLVDFGLVEVQAEVERGTGWITSHPLIREHFARKLQKDCAEAFKEAHSRLFDHLCQAVLYRPDTIDGISPLYQAIVHGCLAERQQETLENVYYDRILRGANPTGYFSRRKLGTMGADLAAVAAFFEHPWSRVSERLKEADQAEMLGEAGYLLRALGRSTEAFEPLRASLERWVQVMNWKEAAIIANNLCEVNLMLGRVTDAVADVGSSINYLEQSGEEAWRLRFLTMEGNAFLQSGRWIEAGVSFNAAERMYTEDRKRFDPFRSLAGFSYFDWLFSRVECSTWRVVISRRSVSHEPDQPIRIFETRPDQHDLKDLEDIEKRAHEMFAYKHSFYLPIHMACDQLTLARITLMRAILMHGWPQPTLSIPHVFSAEKGLRDSGEKLHLPRGLFISALYHAVRGDMVAANIALDEVQEIAERAPLRLHLADVYLHRARLFFREKKYPWKSPQDDLSAAEKLINDCGYHRRDQELADAKRAIFSEVT